MSGLLAVEYGRFSSNNQREESIDAQLRAIGEYAERNGIEIVGTFKDEAISGKSDNRDEFQKMIHGILKGHIKTDIILVHKFNRFARNKYDSAVYKKKLKDIGVKVISVTQNIDDTPEGQMMESFLEVMDEYYSANLALEVRKGLKENALKGKSTGGKKILGLSVNSEGNYVPNEQAELVKRIYEEYASGLPKTEICRRLNEEGYKNQYDRPFNTRTIFDLLRNEKYIGNYIYTLNKKETIRLEGIIENPIIDTELWERVKQSRTLPSKAKYRERKRYYHLTGKTFCSVCGCSVAGAGAKKQKNGTEYVYYKCVGKTKLKNGCKNTSVNKEWFEGQVLSAVVSEVFTEEAIDEIARLAYDEVEAAREKPVTPTKTLVSELSKISSKQEKITELYLDGDIGKDVLDKKNEELKSRKAYLEREIDKNKRLEESQSLSVDEVKNYIVSYKDKLNELQDTDFMKAVFDTFVHSIEVSVNTVFINIYADFSRMYGDNVKNAGAIRTLSPIKIESLLHRKTNIFGRNHE